MPKSLRLRIFVFSSFLILFVVFSYHLHAAGAKGGETASPGVPLWDLALSGGVCMIFLALLSLAAATSVIYHFRFVKPEKLVPMDFTENVLSLIEKKEIQKAVSVCKQQENLVSAIVLAGLGKLSKGPAVAEEVMQREGKARIEKLWQNLTTLGDIAVIAPMLGLLGTVFGMIDAFHFFKAGSIHPAALTQGLAKAMVNTAFGLVIAVPVLGFYSYFRGRVSHITSLAEGAVSELALTLRK